MSREPKIQKGSSDEASSKDLARTSAGPALEAGYHHRLGNTLLNQGKFDEALRSYSRALAINPNSSETINSLGVALYNCGRLQQSAVCYQKAISLAPDYAEAHNNYGLALQDMARMDDALASFARSIHYKPTLAEAHSNLGALLVWQIRDLGRGDIDEAISRLRTAIKLQPDLADAHMNLGSALKMKGLLSEAVRSYEHTLSLVPGSSYLYSSLAEAYTAQGKIQQAVQIFQKAAAIPRDPSLAFSKLLCLYGFTRHISPEAEKAIAKEWEKGVLSAEERALARKRAPADSGAFPASPRAGRKLRLGIVSADMGSHATAHLLEPILEALDRSRFHLTLFYTLRRTCAGAERFRSYADSFISLYELSDGQAADRIRIERIDVLVDTGGHECAGRLGIFAHRAAPVQCAYCGYSGTTGLTEMDWVFSMHPLAAHYSEQVWELPIPGICYRGEQNLPESSWSPDPDGTVWLGSLCRYTKVREETLALWAKVLLALPEAKLLLEDGALCQDETHQRILAPLVDRGISKERVTFVPYIPGHGRHMDLYNRLDIAIDTIPFNGGTTAFDSLWMGVPLVALEGDSSASRMGSLILDAFDRAEWVARNEEEYVSIVCALAHNIEYRKEERKNQRARMALSRLCDGVRMTRALEGAFEEMFDLWIAGAQRKPDSA